MSNKSNWKFDGNITPIFDGHVRSHVPLYNEIHDMVTSLSGWFIEDGTNVYDIGTSLGEVIANLSSTYMEKDVKYFGIDTSQEMVEKTKERFFDSSNISIVNEDVTDDVFKINNASLVTSVLTMMFISQKDRRNVIRKIYDGLSIGAAFIIVEKIVGNNARTDEMWVELYHDMKLKNGVSEVEIFNKSRAIRGVLRPNTVAENMELLNSAGFKDVDIFFKWGNFVGFIAVK